VLVALVASAQGVLGTVDICLPHPTRRCAPNFPGMQSLGLLGGWEVRRGARGSAARALAGPAAFRSEEGAMATGLQGRRDVATPMVGRLALVGWGQAGLVPRLRGDSYRVASVGLGARLR
jgi:hypothetical protein